MHDVRFFFFQAEDGIRDVTMSGTSDVCFFFSSRRRHTRFDCDWSSDVCSSDLYFDDIQRQDLNAIEIGISYKRLIEECNITQEELSDRIGMNRTTVTNYIRLLDRKSVV